MTPTRTKRRKASIGARKRARQRPTALIVIGAMPDDTLALREILDGIPENSTLSLILVPYVAPRSRRPFAALPADPNLVEARAGLDLEPNRIYVVRHDRPLVLRGGRFGVAPSARTSAAGATLSALLTSLARTSGAKPTCVLLSGTCPGTTDILQTIKQHGGRTIVQDPASAVFDEVPRAVVASGLADHVLTPAMIARELAALPGSDVQERKREDQTGAEFDVAENEAETVLDESFRKVLSLLKGRFHLDLSMYKLNTIRRRVQRRMSLSRFDDMASYVEHLRASPDALKVLHDDLFIHVTQFFRDPESFTALTKLVFPALLKARGEDPIRVWVPGCSTGEEAFSIGMALIEFLEQRDIRAQLQIFATDISEKAIAAARKAEYPEALLSQMTPQRLERFFERIKDGYRIRKELRDACIISRHDLLSNPPFAKLDLVSCRNVLIYFGAELQKKVVPIFHFALKPGGFLWLGHAETPGTLSNFFSVIDKHNKIYTKVPSPRAYLQLAASGFTAEKIELPRSAQRVSKHATDFHKSADEVLLFKYGPPAVVINRELEIVQFRGRTAPFLEPAIGHPTHNLFKMAHPDLLPILRPLIQSAQKQNVSMRRDNVSIHEAGKRRTLHVELTPLNPLAAERDRQYLLVFEPPVERGRSTRSTKARAGAPGRAERRPARTDSKALYVEQLQQELDSLREYQQALIEQFESTQEELRSANEELHAANEEFQSTNEELETAKEELQAANEELTTMNDELQNRNAELVSVNEKLARGEDRFRLMVEGVKDYAIYMLDPEGRITTWNEGARRLKGYEASEIIGQHYSRFFLAEDVAASAPEHELDRARIEGRYQTEGWRVRKDGSRFWAYVIVTRINDSTGDLIGFSKVTRDLTEPRRAAEELEKTEQRFRLMISCVRDYAIFTLDPEGRVSSWNEGARRLNGYEEAEILGKHFSVFYPREDVFSGKVEREIETALSEGRVEDEGWRIRKDGTRLWANVVITRVNDAAGKLIGFTKVTRDLSERRRAEEELRKANEGLEMRVRERTQELERALKTRDEFLSIASHELKTPLTALKLQLQLASRRTARPHVAQKDVDAARSTLDRILKQTLALEELVEDLLDISRIQAGHFTLELRSVDVAELIEEVVARFSDQLSHAGSTIQMQLERGVIAQWDERRIAQVIVNLLSNAIKYAPKSEILLSATTREQRVEISVRDRGPGISPENQSTIFDRFERAGASPNVGGLGLGLFIVRRIVEAHEGTIRVESQLGVGTRFVVQLPLVPSRGDLQAQLE